MTVEDEYYEDLESVSSTAESRDADLEPVLEPDLEPVRMDASSRRQTDDLELQVESRLAPTPEILAARASDRASRTNPSSCCCFARPRGSRQKIGRG